MTAKPPEEFTDKCWGKTRPIMMHNNVEVHVLNAKKGGYSSEHKHRKWNRFYVVSGIIQVWTWFGKPRKCPSEVPACHVEKTILSPGEHLDVTPGRWHQFRVIEDAIIIETYWIDLDPNDIERRTIGGKGFNKKD